MSGAIRFDLRELEAVDRRFAKLAVADKRGLMDAIGFTVENQARDRIAHEKESPGGEPWKPWSPNYAKTRAAGQSLLQAGGDLLDTLTYVVDIDGSGVEIGSNQPYAAIQQFGGTEDMAPGPAAIRARPYLGISDDNKEELESVALDWLHGQIHGAPL